MRHTKRPTNPRRRLAFALFALVASFAAAQAPTPLPSPSATVTWTPGQEMLDASKLRPFRALYAQTAGGAAAGRRAVSLVRETSTDGPIWRYVIAIETTATVRDELTFLASDFRPLVRRIAAPGMMHRTEVWQGFDGAVAAVLDAAGQVDRQEITLSAPRFAAQTLELMTALHGNGDLRVPIYSSDFGPEGNLWVDVDVGEPEEVDVAGRTWRARPVRESILDASGVPLALPDGSAFPVLRKWLVAEPPYLVRAEYGPLGVELERVTTFER